MRIRRLRVFAIFATIALVGTALAAAPAGAGQEVQGITDDEIVISALVADINLLKQAGILPSNSQQSTESTLRRAQGYADLYGPIHGRKVVFKVAGWNPLDATTFDKACTIATQDNKPFLVINGGGYRADSVACITDLNDTPAFIAESMYGAIQKASGKNLVSLALPAEVNGTASAFFLDKTEQIPKDAKVGIISANEPQRKAAADSLQAELKKRGYDVVRRVEINTLQADTAASNRESAAAVTTLMQSGADHVLVAIAQTSQSGFWPEWKRNNQPFKPFIIDVAGASCTTFSAPRLPAEAAGAPCVTVYDDSRAVPEKNAVRKDTAFEAKCRKQYAQFTGWTPTPGAQNGGTNVAGQHWDEDIPKAECTMMNVLLPALEKAGKNPTWAKVRKNILATTGPMAFHSGGDGGFAADKPYMADKVHMVTLNPAAGAAKDANGITYNGCPLPINCWVPVLIDGQEWFPAKTGSL